MVLSIVRGKKWELRSFPVYPEIFSSLQKKGLIMRALLTCLFSGMLLLSAISCNAAVAPIPEGEYNCHKISGAQLIHLAMLEIKGSTYRFSKEEQFAPFTIDAKKEITWSKGVSFLPDGWKLGISKYEGPNAQGEPRLTIRYTSASGNAEVIDAVKEKK
jgi:hypothetical protein